MNSSLSFALKATVSLALAAACGCGPGDGSKEFADGRAAFAARDFAKAVKLFERRAELAPGDADAALMLSRSHLELGNLTEARAAIVRAQELAGDDCDVIAIAAHVAWHQKDYELARKLFDRLARDTKLEPGVQSLGWAGLGLVEMALDNRDRARIGFLRAIRLDRRNASAWYHLGLVYRDAFGYSEAALEQFEVFVRLAAAADGRVQKVQRTFIPQLKEMIAQSAASISGADKRDSAASAEALKRAEEAWAKGNFKTAKLRYCDAFTADPLSYPAALGLARAWEKTDSSANGQKEALYCYRRACALRPSAISTFLAAGALAVKLDQHQSAAEIFSRAMAADPANITAIDGLIRARRKCGDAAVADAYQKYRDTIPVRRK